MNQTPAQIFRRRQIPSSAIPSSSPAFGTPVHPLRSFNPDGPKAAILSIILPPATLRPLAFRTFTKKHSLTLSSTALAELASFIGRHCGSGWREEGLAERVLEEVARSWKNRNGDVIVEGSSPALHEILRTLEGNMSGGKIVGPGRGLPRGDTMLNMEDVEETTNTRLGMRPAAFLRDDSNTSFGMSGLGVQEDDRDDDNGITDPRSWIKVLDAYEQPRMIYNVDKKHFEKYSCLMDPLLQEFVQLICHQGSIETITIPTCGAQDSGRTESLQRYTSTTDAQRGIPGSGDIIPQEVQG